MNLYHLIFLGFLSFCQIGIVLAQDSFVIPKIEKNVCPFEGCQFGQWIIEDTINVFESEGDTTNTKFILTPNDTITSILGNIHYLNFGKVLIKQSFNNFAENDTLIVLRCLEGDFIAYYRGEKFFIDVFWPIKYYESEDNEEIYDKSIHKGVMIERPNLNWWVKILYNNSEGWLKLKNMTPYCFDIKEKIRGMDLFE